MLKLHNFLLYSIEIWYIGCLQSYLQPNGANVLGKTLSSELLMFKRIVAGIWQK